MFCVDRWYCGQPSHRSPRRQGRLATNVHTQSKKQLRSPSISAVSLSGPCLCLLRTDNRCLITFVALPFAKTLDESSAPSFLLPPLALLQPCSSLSPCYPPLLPPPSAFCVYSPFVQKLRPEGSTGKLRLEACDFSCHQPRVAMI